MLSCQLLASALIFTRCMHGWKPTSQQVATLKLVEEEISSCTQSPFSVVDVTGWRERNPCSHVRDCKSSVAESMVYCAGAPGTLTSGQVATLDVLVKEMLGRSDRPFSIADVMQRCAEKRLALSEAAITQASTLKHWLMTLVMPAWGALCRHAHQAGALSSVGTKSGSTTALRTPAWERMAASNAATCPMQAMKDAQARYDADPACGAPPIMWDGTEQMYFGLH